ncbi:MAG TPA: ABC transporter substrate-binding protein [Caldilineaceae bacterium]|nr:ABC transporter substrate-binding protein [Caldilineaceae bacterium]
MKVRKSTVQLCSWLLVAALLLAACGAPAAPAPTTGGEEAAPAAEAPAVGGSAGIGGAVLTDKPADAGEREVTTEVYNSPAEAGGIAEYHEAPQLAEVVNSGDLPPIDERLPLNPIVVKPEEAIGKYGGVMRKLVTGQTPAGEIRWWMVEPLTLHSPKGEIIPNVAESWDWNDDYTQLTLNLRRGLHWSDGEPFTANDVLFWWEDVILNEELTPNPPTLLTRGDELAEFAMLDDFTVQFTFAEPYALFTTYLGSWGGPREGPTTSPKHYLSQFHPKYTDMAEIEAQMAEGSFDNWADLFGQKNDAINKDKPTLGAWIPTTVPPNPAEVYVRNPYFWKIDTDGNQLPYIDEVRETRVADAEAALLKTIAGEVDFVRALGTANIPILSENKESGDYRFAYADWMPNAYGNIMFNYATEDEAKSELYNQKEFRQALSVAINRDEIIKLIYKGGVFASQIAPMRGEPYHGESELFQSWAQYDPDLANQMLDDLGLTERDADGFRLAPNGEELLLVISATTAWPAETPELMELVKGYWADVGINATVTPEAGPLWGTRHSAGEHDVSARGGHFGGGPVHPTLNANTFALGGWQWGPEWALWLDTNGEQGVEPPDDVKQLRVLRDQILGEPDEAKRNELMQEVFALHMDNLWSIGLVVDDPKFGQLANVHNRLRNVVTWSISGEWTPTIPAQWFINE